MSFFNLKVHLNLNIKSLLRLWHNVLALFYAQRYKREIKKENVQEKNKAGLPHYRNGSYGAVGGARIPKLGIPIF